MGNNRSKVPDLEKLVKGGRKKFVRYEEVTDGKVLSM